MGGGWKKGEEQTHTVHCACKYISYTEDAEQNLSRAVRSEVSRGQCVTRESHSDG